VVELKGTLEGIGLPAVVQLIGELHHSGTLQLKRADVEGLLAFEDGHLVAAECGESHGLQAIAVSHRMGAVVEAYDVRPFAVPYVKNLDLFKCPSDFGVDPTVVPLDPTKGQPVWKVEGSSYCLNTVMMRLHSLAAIPLPADTYMGAEVLSWHTGSGDAARDWKAVSGPANTRSDKAGPVRVAYFVDSHVKLTTEKTIASQCSPPAAPGIDGPIP